MALQELWRGGSLTRGAYPGLTDAISRRADTFLNYVDFQADSPHQERPSQERDEIIRVLLDLVSVPTLEDGRAPMRRQRWQDELVGNSPARRQLVAELVEARLCAVTLEPRGDQQSDAVNLIHESLLANWPYLQEQIQHEQEALLRQARFESFFNEWVSSKPDERDGYLLSGARLEDARQLLANGSIALKDPQAQELLRTFDNGRIRNSSSWKDH